jgi:plasmid stability protein
MVAISCIRWYIPLRRFTMATLQVRDIDDRLYNYLRTSAKRQNRSISLEVITIIQNYLNKPHTTASNATLEFLELSGAWKDERTADDIMSDIRTHRTHSPRFGEKNGIFN